MKYPAFLLMLFITIVCAGQEKLSVHIQKEYAHYPISKFINEFATANHLAIYLKPSWEPVGTIELEPGDFSLTQILDKLSVEGKFTYYIGKSGDIYIFPTCGFVDQLPGYQTEDNTQQKDSKSAQDNFLKGRSANLQQTIIVGEPTLTIQNKKVKVTGYLTSETNGEPVIGATIQIKNSTVGAITNGKGELSLNLKPGTYDVVFQCIGMQEINCELKVLSAGVFNLKMKQENVSIEEVVVKKESVKRGSKNGVESVNYMTMKEIPALMGEKDVIKVAQMLPGVVSVSEGSGGVNVRGGNADQNLFYIDKIPVYNSSHLFGFFTSINSSIVENFSVYKGQVPSNMGGRLSSVFDIQTRKANKNKFFTEGGVSPISANITLETPIVKNKLGLLVSGRTTYSNWILKQLKDPNLRNSKASFYDLMGSASYSINEKSSLNVLGYISNDYFNLNSMTTYSYGNSGGVLEYNYRFSPVFKFTGNLVTAGYRFQTIEESTQTDAYQHKYNIQHNEIKTEFEWNILKNHSVKFGASSIYYTLDRGNVSPFGSESLRKTMSLGKEQALESAIYVGDEFKLGSRFTGYAGIRYSLYNELGPKTVREYYNGAGMDDQTVENAIDYKECKVISKYSSPELRFGADYRIGLNSSLKFAYTQMQQYLFMLSNSISIAPTDQWKLADSHIKPQHSEQYSVGYYKTFPRKGILASGEVYYKMGKDIIDYKDGADFLSTPYTETLILPGSQKAYGAEFMVSKEKGKLNGWISYTYSRSLMTVDGKEEWAKINNGEPFPSNYDKPHVVNLVLNWKINRRISLSSNMVYNTGRPITLPIGIYYLEGYPYVDYSARNQYRIPDYFRSDFSMKVEGNLKKKKLVHSYFMLSVYNVTGRKNVNTIYFKSEEGKIRGYQYSVIGVPIFTISWNWKLGNYANN